MDYRIFFTDKKNVQTDSISEEGNYRLYVELLPACDCYGDVNIDPDSAFCTVRIKKDASVTDVVNEEDNAVRKAVATGDESRKKKYI